MSEFIPPRFNPFVPIWLPAFAYAVNAALLAEWIPTPGHFDARRGPDFRLRSEGRALTKVSTNDLAGLYAYGAVYGFKVQRTGTDELAIATYGDDIINARSRAGGAR